MEPCRCPWCLGTEKMTRYHDEEWGWPLHDDRKQFEYLMLEAMQCGLSWNLMIEKREISMITWQDASVIRIFWNIILQ